MPAGVADSPAMHPLPSGRGSGAIGFFGTVQPESGLQIFGYLALKCPQSLVQPGNRYFDPMPELFDAAPSSPIAKENRTERDNHEKFGRRQAEYSGN